MYKCTKLLIANEVLRLLDNPFCNITYFFVYPIHSVYTCTELVWYLGPRFRGNYLLKSKIRSPLKVISKKSKNGNQLIALAEFAKSLYQTLLLHKLYQLYQVLIIFSFLCN